MAQIIEEKIVVMLSRIAPSSTTGLGPVLDTEQIETLQKAVEGLVDDNSVVVEIVV